MGLEERAQQRELDGFTYEVTPVLMGVGRPALIRFMKLAQPVLDELIAAAKGDTIVALKSALRVFVERVTDEDCDYFSKTFGPSSKFLIPMDQTGGEERWVVLVKAQQDMHFAGRYMQYIDWLTFCMEVN